MCFTFDQAAISQNNQEINNAKYFYQLTLNYFRIILEILVLFMQI